jgi:diguanylate cyclase (GGDEF)-like protein/PAS domain S-box-containing protein
MTKVDDLYQLAPIPLPVSQVMLDQLIEQSPIGIALIDADGIWRSVNPAYCTLYGYRREEMLGRSFTLVFAPPQREHVLTLHRRFLSDGGELKGEWAVLRRDGVVLEILSESVRVDGPDGSARRLVYVVDITEQRRNEALLRDLAASIPGAMFRLALMPPGQWRFVYMSPGIQALFGVTPEQACADHQALRRCILAEDVAAHDAAIRAAITGGQSWEHEYRIHTALGGTFKWVHARAQRKSEPDGTVVWTGVLSDVTERKRIEAELRASEQTYRTLFETVPQGVVYHAADGRITSANPAAQRILGLSLAQLQGLTPVDAQWRAIHEDGSPFPGEQHPAAVALRTGEAVRNVVMGVAVPGQGHVWILVNATPLFRDGRLDEVYASFEDITQRVLLARELRQQAGTDALTGAANRRTLIERLKIEFERMQRHPELHCAVVAIDLDHFKRINDQWGHAAGDAVLIHVTALMRQGTRLVDLVARSGGEEFTLLLPDTSIADALALAERLRQQVAAQPAWVAARLSVAAPPACAQEPVAGCVPASAPAQPGHHVAVTLSLGVSLILPSDITLDDVLARADLALYAAKAGGRNRVSVAPASAA